jgi:hypothetical protein
MSRSFHSRDFAVAGAARRRKPHSLRMGVSLPAPKGVGGWGYRGHVEAPSMEAAGLAADESRLLLRERLGMEKAARL